MCQINQNKAFEKSVNLHKLQINWCALTAQDEQGVPFRWEGGNGGRYKLLITIDQKYLGHKRFTMLQIEKLPSMLPV